MIAGLLLVTAGALLLLTNLGVISTGVWLGMLALWPVAMIAIGVTLVIPREAEVARASVATLALLALIGGGSILDGQELPIRGRNAEINIPVGEVQRADIDLEAGAGRLRVSGGAEAGSAISGVVGLSRGQRLIADGAQRDDIAKVRIAAEGRWFRLGLNPNRVPPWNLQITDSVPLQLRISSGVAETELDLRGLNIEEARIDVGLGRIEAILPDRGRPRVRVDGRVGEILVRLPDTIPARVAINSGVGTTSVEGPFRREGDVYTTSGWDDASERLDVTIDTGMGSVRVQRR